MSKRSALCLVIVSLASPGCYLQPESADAAEVDPARADPSDPIPACTPTCETHLGTLCVSATEGSLCTCAPRGNSGKGRWDCVPDWLNRSPACAAGTEHGAACPRVIDAIDQACRISDKQQTCFCNQGRTWRCAVFGK